MSAAGVRVVEVDRSDRQDRRRQGKSDPLDAVSAARAAQSGRARGAPKGRDGAVEAIRALMIAKRSARSERTQAINQARALIVTGPEDLRARFAAHATADLVTDLAALRPRPGAVIGCHTRIALRELGRRAEFPGSQIISLDALIVPLASGHAPRPARPARRRLRHGRLAADRRRGPPRAAALRSLWRARTRAEYLTWASTLGARALSPRLSAHGPVVRLAGAARAERHLEGRGDLGVAARGRGPAPSGRPPEAGLG